MSRLAEVDRTLFSIVCISPQEWDADLPTNRQQIMRRAARRGHDVLYVESGSFLWRAPRSTRTAWTELRRRLFGRFAENRVHVRSALNVVPWGKRYALASTINFKLTAWMLRRAVRALRRPVIVWMYDPCAVAMVGSLGEAFAVYDCVDDYPEQYGPDARRRALVASADREAGERARLVFATTDGLVERHRQGNPRTYLVPNVGDYEHFAPAADRELAALDVRDLPGPVIGFAGNLLPGKVDFRLLDMLSVERPSWTLLLVGPARAGAEHELASVTRRPNVLWLGWKSYDDLPRYIAAFDVGLCPYVSNAYTRNVFPLKVYEYLAAGKPVVASGTPSLAGMEPDVVLTDSPAAFLAAVDTAVSRSSAEDRGRRMALAAQNTWDTRTERLLELVTVELGH